MKTNLRKILALLLCLAMCLSLVPAAWAEDELGFEEPEIFFEAEESEEFSFEEPAFGEESEEPVEEAEPEPAEEPAFSEEPAEKPAEEPVEEEPAEEPAEEELAEEEPAFGEEPAEEEPAFSEEPAEEEPAFSEEPAEEPAFGEEPAEEEPAEEEPAEGEEEHEGEQTAPEGKETAFEITITAQPKNASAVDGAVEFSVTAEVSPETELVYRWERLNQNAYEDGWESVENGNGPTLRVIVPDDEQLTQAAKYAYRCVITAGDCSVCSEVARVLALSAVEDEEFDADAHSGTWGSLRWELDSSGNLRVSGSGSMNGFSGSDYDPGTAWRAYSSSIKTLTVCSGVTNISYQAFDSCRYLTTVTIEEGVTKLDKYAFWYCDSLKTITIPKSVTTITSSAFNYCANLKDVYYNGTRAQWNAISIGSNNSALTGATLHVSGGSSSHSGTWGSLRWELDSSGNLRVSGSGSMNGFSGSDYDPGTAWRAHADSIKTLTVCSGVTNISYQAFDSCKYLTTVTIEEGVTKLDQYAFWHCDSLKTITIPKSVTTITSSAFNYCANLRDVYYNGTRAQWNAISIGSNNSALTGATLHLQESGTLATPTLVSATVSGSSIVVRWNAVAGAAGYRVYRKYSGVNWTALANVSGTSYTDRNISSGTTYTYTVRCLNSSNQTVSGFNATGVSARYVPGQLATPTLVSATASGSSIVFRWNAVSGSPKYRVYRKCSGGAWTALANVSGTSYTDWNVRAGTVYIYTVRCLNASNQTVSDYDARGKSAYIPLATPTLSSAAASGSSIIFRWNSVSGASKYRVYRKYDSVNWTAIANVSGTSYTDRNVRAGTVYTYTVRCLDAANQTVSGFNTAGKSAYLSLATPTLVSATASGTSIVFKWNSVSGASKYRVYRKYGSTGWTAVANLTATSYTDSNVTRGTTYTYTVRCLSSDGRICVSDYNKTGLSAKVPSNPSSNTTYRALLIGNENYSTRLPGCRNDMITMRLMLSGLSNPYQCYQLPDATARQIYNAIPQAFSAATDNDVSLFFYSGHGAGNSGNLRGALIGVDGYGLTMTDLASQLSRVRGRVIVLLDSCHSGAAISNDGTGGEASLDSFNQDVVDAFAAFDSVIVTNGETPDIGEMRQSKFIVITASRISETSQVGYESGYPFGKFTRGLVEGCGFRYLSSSFGSSMPGDRNGDRCMSAYETYKYAYDWALARNSGQHAQFYAANQNEIIFRRN